MLVFIVENVHLLLIEKKKKKTLQRAGMNCLSSSVTVQQFASFPSFVDVAMYTDCELKQNTLM